MSCVCKLSMKIRYPPSQVNNLDLVPLSWCITLHSPSVVTPLDYYAQGINLNRVKMVTPTIPTKHHPFQFIQDLNDFNLFRLLLKRFDLFKKEYLN